MTTSQVREALGCSLPEINRWSADGRLPHLFSRKIQVHRTVTARFWESDRVRATTAQVAVWREQDTIRRRFKRQGLTSIAGYLVSSTLSLNEKSEEHEPSSGKTLQERLADRKTSH